MIAKKLSTGKRPTPTGRYTRTPVSARVLSTIDPAPEPALGYGELQAQLLLRCIALAHRISALAHADAPPGASAPSPLRSPAATSLGAHSRCPSRAASS